jgi:ubiquitin-conjugating enzyme E2 Z
MSSNPYENEPGFEDAKEPHDKKNQKDYVAKVNNILDYPNLRLIFKS